MISLNEFADSITLARETLESFMPSSFVSYTTVKEKSSHIELASSGGTIKKVKKRSVERTLYEFLALRAWHDLLETYSSLSPLSFRAPLPRGVYDLDKNETSLYMDFMQGYDVRKMGQNLRRTFPVRIKGQDIPIPLYPACALHLGALDCVREHEGVYHGDYDTIHIIFSPARDVSLAVIDVECSRTESRSDIDT